MNNTGSAFFTQCRKLFILIVFLGLPDGTAAQIMSFEFEGRPRQYEVCLPVDFRPHMPVILVLHGWTVGYQWMKTHVPVHELAGKKGFITVYPDAINRAWNAFPGCDPNGAIDTTVNDVGFLSALIDTLKADLDIDLERVYMCGHSLGGVMTYKFAIQMGQRLAAIASVAGPMWTFAPNGKNPVRTLSVMHMHGTKDDLALYDGQPDCADLWGAEETVAYWVRNNGCVPSPDTVNLPDLDPADSSTVQQIIYSDCDGDGQVVFYKLLNHTHGWPGNAYFDQWGAVCKDIDATTEIIRFFNQFRNPLADLAY